MALNMTVQQYLIDYITRFTDSTGWTPDYATKLISRLTNNFNNQYLLLSYYQGSIYCRGPYAEPDSNQLYSWPSAFFSDYLVNNTDFSGPVSSWYYCYKVRGQEVEPSFKIKVYGKYIQNAFPDLTKISRISYNHSFAISGSGQLQYSTSVLTTAEDIADWMTTYGKYVVNENIKDNDGTTLVRLFENGTYKARPTALDEYSYFMQVATGVYMPLTTSTLSYNLFDTGFGASKVGDFGISMSYFNYALLSKYIDTFPSNLYIPDSAFACTITYDNVAYNCMLIDKTTIDDVMNLIMQNGWEYVGDLAAGGLYSLAFSKGTLSPSFDTLVKTYTLSTTSKSFTMDAQLDTSIENPNYIIRRSYDGGQTYTQVDSGSGKFIRDFGITMSGNSEGVSIGVYEGDTLIDVYSVGLSYSSTPTGGGVEPGQSGTTPINNDFGSGQVYDGLPSFPQEMRVVTTSYGNNIYFLTPNQLRLFRNALWGENFNDLIQILFFGNNESSLLSLVLWPFDISQTGVTVGSTTNISLGRHIFSNIDTDIKYNIGTNANFVIDFGELKYNNKPIERYFGTFLDFNPYTHFYIYLPYVGYREIDPAKVYDKKLKLKYYCDLITGTAKIVITDITSNKSLKGIILYEWNCQVGKKLPLIFDDATAQITKAIGTSLASAGAFAATGGISAVTSGISGAVKQAGTTNLMNSGIQETLASMSQSQMATGDSSPIFRINEASKARTEAQHQRNLATQAKFGAAIDTTLPVIGDVLEGASRFNPGIPVQAGSMTNDSSVDRMTTQEVFILIERPKTAIPNEGMINYNNFYGRPSNVIQKLNDLKGITTIPSPRLVTNATIGEKINLINQCKAGIRIAGYEDGVLVY